ncbi:MAG: hypothetical protein WBB31_16630 [Saprospiraceae bacterium]
MAISSKADKREQDCGCRPEECTESTLASQKTINTLRLKYCDEVYAAAGTVIKWEKTYSGETKLFNLRKCMFVWTEGNYQRYRNTEICLGTELMQSTEIIKDNVKNYIEWGTKLSTNLKDIFKKVKEAKGKLGDLVDAACKLNSSKDNTCYQAEWTVITGRSPAKCGEEPTGELPPNYPNKCKDIDKTICDIICMPKALNLDINSIFKSSSEIIGIQIFSNISTLDPLQKSFAEKSKAFDTHLQDVMKLREADMKELQKQLIISVQNTTKAAGSLYTWRSNFESLYDTTKYFCCPKCGCVSINENNCEPRLHDCECKICEICTEVKDTFCTNGCGDQQSQAD